LLLKIIGEKKGFTLIEMLTVLAISGMLMITVYSLFFSGYRSFDLSFQQTIIHQDMRLVENLIYRNLINARCVKVGELKEENGNTVDCGDEKSTLNLENDGELYFLKHNERKITNDIFADIIVQIKKDEEDSFTNILVFIFSFSDHDDYQTQIKLNNYSFKDLDSNAGGLISLKDEVLYFRPVN